ncbi:hypothetical protein FNV43_RR04325 [Rhamnella rubrinervis]|uniref:Uncharacterized protein n=1 Tax=Rhamnella rubrinervis TaxID=2594499 RepID=A0A8K0HLN9_9ROSA|nr:hypothetical protein FNV43_RR04325 [Rhamnella rubrinervis]
MPIGPYSRFNSHPLIEDIIETKDNSNIDDFLVDHDSVIQNSNRELAPINDSELHIAEVVKPHVFSNIESFFNQNLSSRIINTQLV